MAKKSNAANAGSPTWKGKGNGFAQSGGKATTFQGGNGGNGYGKGSTSRRKTGTGQNNLGNTYTTVAPGGDATPAKLRGGAGKISGTKNTQGYGKAIKRNYNNRANG